MTMVMLKFLMMMMMIIIIIIIIMVIIIIIIIIIISTAQQLLVDQGFLIIEASRTYSVAPHSVGLLWRVIGPTQRTVPDNK